MHMPLIRKLEITGFRGIKTMCWLPAPGLNALVGPGDSSKSTILDAIDWCMGLRRSITVSESDFHRMDISRPIRITATIGQLPPELMSLSRFGECLRGFTTGSPVLQPEPHARCENVIQLVLKIEQDLEPQWFVVKHDGDDDDVLRLTWAQRQLLAPVRIGTVSTYHMSWRRDSALAKLTEGDVSASAVLSTALRTAREAFAANPPPEVDAGLTLAKQCCIEFAIFDIDEVEAGLDIDAVGAGDNCVALHDQDGVPLRRLGTGSSRLLSSALVARAGEHPLLLLDELEHGLEPHRIIRLLHAIGSKDKDVTQQVFTTTHSPVAVSELTVSQLWIVRRRGETVCLDQPGEELQGTVRAYPNALLARKILVCEGASEVGIIRGMDIFLRLQPVNNSFSGGLLLHGLAIVDGRGSSTAANALSLINLGYPTAMLRDSDVAKKKPKDKQKWDASLKAEEDFVTSDGKVFCWEDGLHTEAVVFHYGTDDNVKAMVAYAEDEHSEEAIAQDVSNFGAGTKLGDIKGAWLNGAIDAEHRKILGLCANKRSWFKRIDRYEHITSEILLPAIKNNTLHDGYLRTFLIKVAQWCAQ
jgi:putative ATP-dependent endonuclease of the OLD family